MESKKLNLNSYLVMLLMAGGTLISYLGSNQLADIKTSVSDSTRRIATLSEKMAAIEAINFTKVEQLTRIENQLTHQQTQINDMQVEMARIKGKP